MRTRNTIASLLAGAALATTSGVVAASSPAEASGCSTNVYRVTRHAGVYGYEEKVGDRVYLRGRLKYKNEGDRVTGPHGVHRTPPHTFVALGGGQVNPYTNGTLALMANSALDYQYCY
jgi:hypothetical protein